LSKSSGLGFGGFLLGLGVGWVVFQYLEITSNILSWLLILGGAGVIVSALFQSRLPDRNIGGLVSGVMGGLILALFITSGFGFIGDIARTGISATYRARDTKSYSGTVTAGRVYLGVDNFNGPIRVSTWDKAEYKIDLDIRAREEKHLDDLKVDLDESETQDQKRITLSYDIPRTEMTRYAIEVEVYLPADAVIDLELDSSNGGIYLTEIEGDDLRMASSNGPISFDDVYGEKVVGTTSNGRIEGDLESEDAILSTSNGEIDLTLPCTVTGDYDLSTSNGAIDLTVSKSAQVGYDLDLSTSNGSVNIDLPDLDYTVNQRTSKEAKTEGFSGKEIRITIEGSASNSSIDVDT